MVLFDKLWTSEDLKFGEIRRLLGFVETIRFNLERGERGHMKGNKTDHLLASKKSYGGAWDDVKEQTKDEIFAYKSFATCDLRTGIV